MSVTLQFSDGQVEVPRAACVFSGLFSSLFEDCGDISTIPLDAYTVEETKDIIAYLRAHVGKVLEREQCDTMRVEDIVEEDWEKEALPDDMERNLHNLMVSVYMQIDDVRLLMYKRTAELIKGCTIHEVKEKLGLN